MKTVSAIFVLFASCAIGVAGAETYKWVDEHGKTHYGDSVPEQYQPKKQPLKLDKSPSAAERGAAQQRIQKEKDALRSMESQRERNATRRPVKSAGTQNPNETPCQKEWRLYMAAQSCFLPFRTATGGIRAEAYQHCKEMSEPKSICPP